jgi:hypothetical protein
MPGIDEVPVGHTPEGGWQGEMPPPVLAGCGEALTEGAPDLRGTWEVVTVEVNGRVTDTSHPVYGLVQRIEQAGDRMVVTAAGVIHDMRCDGTLENGVNDVAERDFRTRIRVAASYEGSVHVLRPEGIPVEVRRWLDGEEMVWAYPGFVARSRRAGDSE